MFARNCEVYAALCRPKSYLMDAGSRKMPKYMRKQFTDAIRCMTRLPSNLDGNTTYPGVLNRYDDFAAGHLEFNQEQHFTVVLSSPRSLPSTYTYT